MRAVLLLLVSVAACEAPGVHSSAQPELAQPVVAAPPVRAAPRPVPPVRAAPPETADHGGWNAAQIAWRGFDEGVAEARRTHKPMLLVLYATWCGHCANYSHVFDDADVVAASRDFVMVRADSDRDSAVASRFAPDGQYVPRTFFLSPSGDLVPSVKAHEGRFQYFYNEHEAGPLLAAMRTARTAAVQ